MPVPVTFGPFVLDVGRGVLHCLGIEVPVGQRGLALLRVLVDASGEVVGKDALIEAAWPNVSVEESNLTVQIAALRKALSDASGEEWIRTIPRTGYRLLMRPGRSGAEGRFRGRTTTMDQKPSVAVLPFRSLGGDPEQDYFAEGLSADLITDLSQVPGLLVIARNSSFAYKGKSVDLRQIAEELDVRYVVDGGVRRADDRVRINAEVVDSTHNGQIWAERFDRRLADVFALQDEIVGRIVQALVGAIPASTGGSPRRTGNLEAYDYFVRGRALMFESAEANRAARPLLLKAIELDPQFAGAHACLAFNHITAWAFWGGMMEKHHPAALAAAARALSLDPLNADAHANLGYVEMFNGRTDVAAAELARALRIDPNHADAWIYSGELKTHSGEPLAAIRDIEHGLRLNPFPPGWYYWILGYAQYAARAYEAAIHALQHESTRRSGSQRILAASLAQAGRIDEARQEAQEFLAANPDFSMDYWANSQPFIDEADRRHFIDGYLKAGFPRT